MTTTRKKATTIIKIKNIVYVLIVNRDLSVFLFREFGLQSNHFFPDFSKLIFYMLELLFYNSFAGDIPGQEFQSSKHPESECRLPAPAFLNRGRPPDAKDLSEDFPG